ncbi:hypothetical protein [Gordonia humi]|uniref:Uncharacterized protein n=1 Tax=Gordonia humi TaxID=686429 RepID=A0A840F370_9ACTN|nr:hypothetical protein [Gordonia humi]MBB4136376.1 hypothetical protein [Gordonia humi]
MRQPPREVTYTDELLADGTVYRRYSDGRQEWRTKAAEGRASWHDDRGRTGVDEPLGPKIVKREFGDGMVIYGRENGFGRTVWSDGIMTVNRSRFGGRFGALVAGVAGTVLVAGLVYPPDSLAIGEEEALRAQGDPSSSGGDGSSGDTYSDWGDGDGGNDGGDFG